MATILRVDGFRFVIDKNDHEPPHVHVYGGDGTARIRVGDAVTSPTIVMVAGMSDRDARRARRNVGRTGIS